MACLVLLHRPAWRTSSFPRRCRRSCWPACDTHMRRARSANEALAEETGMTRLFSLLRARTRVDFTYYKAQYHHPAGRAPDRRHQSGGLDAYVRYAQADADRGLPPLPRAPHRRDQFLFRDPTVWALLREQVLPKLFTKAAKRDALLGGGVFSRREAYTLAIICRRST